MIYTGGRVQDFSYFGCSSPFFLIEFNCYFSIYYKYYHIMFIIIVFWSGSDLPSGFFSCPLYDFPYTRLSSILTPLFHTHASLPYSRLSSILTPLFHTQASLPYSRLSSYLLLLFILFHSCLPMSECLGKHSFMSSTCPIDILNGTIE